MADMNRFKTRFTTYRLLLKHTLSSITTRKTITTNEYGGNLHALSQSVDVHIEKAAYFLYAQLHQSVVDLVKIIVFPILIVGRPINVVG